MDKVQRKVLRSPTVKRKNKTVALGEKLILDQVLGLTLSCNAAFCCDPVSGTFAYPTGCVVVLFNPCHGKQSHIFNVSKKAITSLSFSNDGKYLVTGESGHQPAVRVWDVEERMQVAELHAHKFGINCVAFSPNMKYLVSIGSQHDMMVNVWTWRTGNKVASNKVSCKVTAVSFGSDSLSFVTVGNRHVKFWYLDDCKSKINQTVPLTGRSGILGEHRNNFFCDVACGRGPFSHCTYVVTQSGLLFEFNERRLLHKWVELHSKSASCLVAGRECIFVGCADGVVRVFSPSTLLFLTTLPRPHHLGVDVSKAINSSDMICTESNAKFPDVMAITFDDDHKNVACVYNDHSLYVWDVVDVRHVGKTWSFLYHSGCIWGLETYPLMEREAVGALPAGSFVTASSDDTIRVWNLNPHMQDVPGLKRNIYSKELLKVVYTEPEYTFLCNINYNPAGATDKTDTTWDGKNGVRSIRISPDGEHLASGDRQGNIRIFDLWQMIEIHSIEAHESDVVCLEYSFSIAGPKLLASGSRDRLIHVFDVEQNYCLLQTLDDHSAAIQSVRFTDNSDRLRMISCGSDKSLLFRNASANPYFEFILGQHLVSKSTMYDMIIDPLQKYLVTACQDQNLRIYNMATAKQKKNYHASLGDEGTLLRVQLDPSGTYAVTSCTDKNLCVLDFYTGELIATAYGHSEIATGLRFTNDLRHLISVSADGRDIPMMPNPSPVQENCDSHLSSSLSAVMGDSISPTNITLSLPSARQLDSSSNRSTPSWRLSEPPSVTQSPIAGYRFSIGQLPKWAKVKLGQHGDTGDSCANRVEPRGRWAQRFDQNQAFKSQLDVSHLSGSGEIVSHEVGRDALTANSLGVSERPMLGVLRKTVTLSPSSSPSLHNQYRLNISIIEDDDTTNMDEEEEFLPVVCLRNIQASASNSQCSSDHGKQKNNRSGLPLERLLTHPFTSLGCTTGDGDDLDNNNTASEATKVVYPPCEPDSVDEFASSFRVFAAEDDKEVEHLKVSSVNIGEREDMEVFSSGVGDFSDMKYVSSGSNTPSDADKEFLPTTPDNENFLCKNFESVNFTPIPMEKFSRHVALLEQAAEGDDSTGFQFSPRLSLSSKFLSRTSFNSDFLRYGLGQRQQPYSELSMDEQTVPPNVKPATSPLTVGRVFKDKTTLGSTIPTPTTSQTSIAAYPPTISDKRRTANLLGCKTSLSCSMSTYTGRPVLSNLKCMKLSNTKSVHDITKHSDSYCKQWNHGLSGSKQCSSSCQSENTVADKTASPLSKCLALHSSIPDLSDHQGYDSDHDVTNNKTVNVDDSNLRSMVDLSLSVPDFTCLGDSDCSDKFHIDKSSNTLKLPYRVKKRSLPSIFQGEDRPVLSSLSCTRSHVDSQRMFPPPQQQSSKPSLYQSKLMVNIPLTSKDQSSELSLEQAKGILLGGSGILSGSQHHRSDEYTDKHANEDYQQSPLSLDMNSPGLSPFLTPNIISSSMSGEQCSTRSDPYVSFSTCGLVEKNTYVSSRTLAVAEEIERTARDLRRQKEMREVVSSLVISRDLPELHKMKESSLPSCWSLSRHSVCNSSTTVCSSSATVCSSSTTVYKCSTTVCSSSTTVYKCSTTVCNSSTIVCNSSKTVCSNLSSSFGSEHVGNMSVLDDICEQNEECPERLSLRNSNRDFCATFASGNRLKYNTGVVSPQVQAAVSVNQSAVSLVTESESHVCLLTQKPSDENLIARRRDRSCLSLKLHTTTAPTSRTALTQHLPSKDPLSACTSVVSELWSAVDRARKFHQQVKDGDGLAADTLSNISKMLGDAFHESHLILSKLALEFPRDKTTKPPSCPLMEDCLHHRLIDTSHDSYILDQTRKKLEPFFVRVSQEFADELTNVVLDWTKNDGVVMP